MEEQIPTVVLVCVHGIGEQHRGDTLRQVGEPLVQAVDGIVNATGGRIEIEHMHTKDEADEKPAYLSLLLHRDEASSRVVIAESTWSDSFHRASYIEMIPWMVRTWALVATSIVQTTRRGGGHVDCFTVRRFSEVKELLSTAVGDPQRKSIRNDALTRVFRYALWPFSVAINLLRLAIYAVTAFAIVAIATTVLIVPIVLVALILGTAWRVTRSASERMRVGIAASLGDAYTFERKTLDRAAMIQSVRSDLEWATDEFAPSAVFVIAHSLGSAIVTEGLTNGALHFDLLVTCGNAIGITGVGNRTKQGTELEDWTHDVPWVDFYTAFDPVPSGPIVNLERQRSSFLIQNNSSPWSDHSSYFKNQEQFATQLAIAVLHTLNYRVRLDTDWAIRLGFSSYVRRLRKRYQVQIAAVFGLGGSWLLYYELRDGQPIGSAVAKLSMYGLNQMPEQLRSTVEKVAPIGMTGWAFSVGVVGFLAFLVFKFVVGVGFRRWDHLAAANATD